jgi:subtilisin family serine protease
VRLAATVFVQALAIAALVTPAGLSSPSREAPATEVITYDSPAALRTALSRYPARVIRRLPDLRSVEVQPENPGEFVSGISALPGIGAVEAPVPRYPASEPALTAMYSPGLSFEWQYRATHADRVPAAVIEAASSLTIAVIDTGVDVTAPDLAAKQWAAHNVLTGGSDVHDFFGHGTFVASIAAGSPTNGEGIAGFGGQAKLLILKASDADGMFTEVDEAAAVVYAVNHGAKVINLSIGGSQTTAVEREALQYAADHGVLAVAAAGNEYKQGNPVEYPAALLQPYGSKGRGGWGLSVGATTKARNRASFSNTGSWISLAAPGEHVFGAISSSAAMPGDWPRNALPGSLGGLYGFSSGTSFSTPQVAGAAALVWAANPSLTRDQVAWILKRTASGDGRWTSDLGYGVLDVGRAVEMAAGGGTIVPRIRANALLKVVGRGNLVAARGWIRINALLRSPLPAISPAGRHVWLQRFRNGSWHRIASVTTRADGTLVLRTRMHKGRYVMRVRYPGGLGLGSAVSRTFRLEV